MRESGGHTDRKPRLPPTKEKVPLPICKLLRGTIQETDDARVLSRFGGEGGVVKGWRGVVG